MTTEIKLNNAKTKSNIPKSIVLHIEDEKLFQNNLSQAMVKAINVMLNPT